MQYIAYTVKGLEEIARRELQEKLSDFRLIESADKYIIFESEESYSLLSSLRTVDDLGIFICRIDKVEELQDLVNRICKIDFENFRVKLSEFRKLDEDTFSLTVGLVGVSRFKSFEIIQALSKKLIEKYNWNFTELDHSNFDIRITISNDMALISVRLTPESLHHRKYKTQSKLGSLRPTIAAAMVLIATNNEKEFKVIDNFCGSGTILCETMFSGNEIYGGDIDPESVEATKNNIGNIEKVDQDRVKILDAIKTTWQNNFFDCAISNLPWDKQVAVKSITNLYEGSIKEYFRILKPGGVLCVLVSKPELFIKYVKKFKPTAKIEAWKIGLLGQNPTIVLVS